MQPRATTPQARLEPRPGRPHDYRAGWAPVPDNGTFDNGFKVQWEALPAPRRLRTSPSRWHFLAGARGRATRRGGAALVARAALGRGPGADDRERRTAASRRADGRLERYAPAARPRHFQRPTAPLASASPYAAAHVVADPLHARWATRASTGTRRSPIGGTCGLGARRCRRDGHRPARHGARLRDHPGVDRAQRCGGARRSVARWSCGAGTDQLAAGGRSTSRPSRRRTSTRCSTSKRRGAAWC